MADISKITLPSGSTYDLKDAWSRSQISSILPVVAGSIVICGKTSTPLSDDSTQTSVQIPYDTTIRGQELSAGEWYTAVAGDAFFTSADISGTVHNYEYVYDGTHWHEFGDMAGIGMLAYKNSGSVTYTPSGEVSVGLAVNSSTASGTFTPSGSIDVQLGTATKTSTGTFTPEGTINVTLSSSSSGTTVIKNPTAKTVVTGATQGTLPTYTAPTCTMPTCTMPSYTAPECTLPTLTTEVENENLSIMWGAGSYTRGSYTDGSWTDGSYTSGSFDQGTLPTFTSADSIDTSNVTVVSSAAEYVISSQTFTGTQNQTISVSGTFVDSITSQTFTGTQNQTITATVTPDVSISSTAFKGKSDTVDVNFN